MSLMRDDELIAAIAAQAPSVPLVEGLALPTAGVDRYSIDSPVQASSVDLHIGNIYLPGEKETDLGGAQQPRTSYSLNTGETAVVTTSETVHLPGDVAAFGFPPSVVSFKGLLMTNPGHVDPGYNGSMRFTVINMGKEPYYLARGGKIVTLLFFKLDNPAHAGWAQRHTGGSTPPTHADISLLSRDFVDVEKRAEGIAKREGLKWSAIIPAGAALLLGILQLSSSGKFFSRADIEDLKKRQDAVEYDVKNRVDVNKKLMEFDTRLEQMQQEISDLEPKTTKPKTGTAPRLGGPGGK